MRAIAIRIAKRNFDCRGFEIVQFDSDEPRGEKRPRKGFDAAVVHGIALRSVARDAVSTHGYSLVWMRFVATASRIIYRQEHRLYGSGQTPSDFIG